jgi:molybdopterin/thiamine biosynthesis adenylyltransferase
VLVLGVRGVTMEVCKNLVLAGVKAVTLVDDAPVSELDLAANFFLTTNDLGSKVWKPLSCLCAYVCCVCLLSLPPSLRIIMINDHS